MRALRHNFYRPWCPPGPAWVVKLVSRLTRTEASLILNGCRCAPKRFLESGFEYQFPDLRGALKNIFPTLGAPVSRRASLCGALDQFCAMLIYINRLGRFY